MERKGLKDQLDAEGCSVGGIDSARRLYNHYIQIAVSLPKMTIETTHCFSRQLFIHFVSYLKIPVRALSLIQPNS